MEHDKRKILGGMARSPIACLITDTKDADWRGMLTKAGEVNSPLQMQDKPR
jgi:hypothetical protein